MTLKQWTLAAILAFGIGGGVRALQDENPPAPNGVFRVSDPEWIVIFNVTSTASSEPVFNFRIVLHARSDGEAVMKATLYVQSKFGVNATDLLEFVEVAPKGVKK